MLRINARRVPLAIALAVVTGLLPTWQGARAQGYKPDDPAALAALPQLTRYRDFEPAKADLSADLPPPGDQGEQSSCVAWSLGYAVRSYYAHRRTQTPFTTPQSVFSPAWIYNRLTTSPRTCEDGLSMLDALNLLHQDGIATAAEFPYDKKSCARQPGPAVIDAARANRISGFRGVKLTADDIKGQLAHGNPVAVGLLVDFPVLSHLRAGQIYNVDSHASHDGHAVALVGYDDTRQAFKFINSWGTDWADHGYGWISYGAFEHDAHVAAVMSDADAPLPPPNPTPGPAPNPGPAPTPGPAPAAVAGDWHGQLAALADTFRCALLALKTEGASATLTGWVGRQEDMDALTALLARLAPQVTISSAVHLYPWPQCEALLTLHDVVQDHGLKLTTLDHDSTDYVAGSRLQLKVRTPDYPSYLYVTYIDASGDAVPLYQPRGLIPQALPANATVTLGAGDDPRVFRIGAPFGTETIVAVAARSPLFSDGVAPKLTERAYLSALRKTLEYQPDPNQPARVVDGDLIGLTTHAATPDAPAGQK